MPPDFSNPASFRVHSTGVAGNRAGDARAKRVEPGRRAHEALARLDQAVDVLVIELQTDGNAFKVLALRGVDDVGERETHKRAVDVVASMTIDNRSRPAA